MPKVTLLCFKHYPAPELEATNSPLDFNEAAGLLIELTSPEQNTPERVNDLATKLAVYMGEQSTYTDKEELIKVFQHEILFLKNPRNPKDKKVAIAFKLVEGA